MLIWHQNVLLRKVLIGIWWCGGTLFKQLANLYMEHLFFNAKYGGGSGQVMLVRACRWSQKVLEWRLRTSTSSVGWPPACWMKTLAVRGFMRMAEESGCLQAEIMMNGGVNISCPYQMPCILRPCIALS